MSSAAVGAISSTRDVTLNPQMEEEELKNNKNNEVEGETGQLPHGDDDQGDDELEEEDDAELKFGKEFDLGPQFSLKEQLEKDKDDESLRKWKELLLGSIDLSIYGETKEPEVKIESLTIQCPGRPDLVIPIPFVKNSKSSLFTLKEGSQYRLKFIFTVSKNIVSGLKYANFVWKTGLRGLDYSFGYRGHIILTDTSNRMLGTFSPQQDPYTCEMEEETTPSGMFARGLYRARTKFLDDDGKCYLDVSYCFEIQRNWPKPF